MEPIQGIWFEKGRNRWRVKIFKDGKLFHRSYHYEYEAAFETWSKAKRQLTLPRSDLAELESISAISQFLRQPLPGGADRRS